MFWVMAGMAVASAVMGQKQAKAQAAYMKAQQEYENKQRRINTYASYQYEALNKVNQDKDGLAQSLALQQQEQKDMASQNVLTAFNGLVGASVNDANQSIATQYKLARSQAERNQFIANENYQNNLKQLSATGTASLQNNNYSAPSLGQTLLATGANLMSSYYSGGMGAKTAK